MQICDVLYAVGRAGYFNKDLQAIRAGATPNGFGYDGTPRTAGFRRVCQPSECLSVMLLLDDGQVAMGDCIDVIFTGAAGRDPLFRASEHIDVLTTGVRPLLCHRACETFISLAAEVDAYTYQGKRLHTALRYGITQALLHAVALAQRCTMAEVVAREYQCTMADHPVPILGMCPTDQLKHVDKMIMKGVDILPHGSFDALRYCRGKGAGLYLGGSANETEQAARVCTHIALACQVDFMMCKPGQGVDEGLMIQTNEMQRTLTLVRQRGAAVSHSPQTQERLP